MEDKIEKQTKKLQENIKRFWPQLAAGAVVVLAISGGAWWYAVSGKGRQATQTATSTTDIVATSTTEAPKVARVLDGVMVNPGEESLPSFAVMIDNQADARPQSGLSQANLVFEIPVEGGLTRFMAVFDATSTADMIGPVRSARPYFVETAQGLHSTYVHVGGSPDALELVQKLPGFQDLNEFFNGKYFWRSKDRLAPHNTYTRVDFLRDAMVDKKWTSTAPTSWKYKDDTATSSRGTLDVPMIRYDANPALVWKYHSPTNGYERYEAGVLKKDKDGSVVRAKNVLVLYTESSVLDSYGRLSLRTTGKGRGFLYHDGIASEIVWRRGAGERYRFESVDGSDVYLNRGTTWVEMLISNPPAPAASSTAPGI